MSLATLTIFAAGFATVNPLTAFNAVYILSAVALLLALGLKKCVFPLGELGDPLPTASDCNVITVPSFFVNVSFVPTAIFA